MTTELTEQTLELVAQRLPVTTVVLRDNLCPHQGRRATFIDKKPHGVFLLGAGEHDPVADPEQAVAHLAMLALDAIRTHRRRLHGVGMTVQVVDAVLADEPNAHFATLIAF